MSGHFLHCFAQSGHACEPALLPELSGADWTPRGVDFPICGCLFREDELGIHWSESRPAIAAWLGRIRRLPRWWVPCEFTGLHSALTRFVADSPSGRPFGLMPGHPRPAA